VVDLDGRGLVLGIVVHGLGVQDSLLGQAHIGSEGAVRNPFAGGTRSGLFQHAVDLLEGEALGFWDEHVGVDEAGGAERAPDEEDAGPEVGFALVGADHVWGDDGDDAVPEPVGGGGESNTTGSDGEREDFTDENPSTWTPGGGEEEDVDADECNLGGGGLLVAIGSGSDTNDTCDELADQHTKSTVDHDWSTTELLNGPEGDWSRADVDEGGDQTDEEGVGDGAELLEEGGTEVEDEVDTSPLLHHLERCTQDGSAEIGR